MLAVVAALLILPLALGPNEWPQWRGPTGQNHASAGATAPEQWSETSGLAWNTPVPGRGHSSPVVVGQRIYLTTCKEQTETQSLLIFDRDTGQLLRQAVAHRGKLPARIHDNNTHASSTVACNGTNVFALFNNDKACWVTAFDLDGNQLWQRRVAGFDPQRFQFGFGSSPIVAGDLLIVASEYDGPDSGLYAIRCEDGQQVWKASRPESQSYSTPILAELDGTKQLLISGHNLIAAYDPNTGSTLWTTKGSTRATCGTMVWDSKRSLAFASGGFPVGFTLAVRTTGDREIAWQNNTKCYEQSLLAIDGYVYAVSDHGIAHCFRADDGQPMWTERLGGRYSSSPLHVDGKVYVSSEQGATFVFRATPERFELVAENQLGDECFATPAPVGGRLFHRYATHHGGQRQEYLAAIGE